MSRKKDSRSKAAEEKFAQVFQSWLEEKNTEVKVMEEMLYIKVCLPMAHSFVEAKRRRNQKAENGQGQRDRTDRSRKKSLLQVDAKAKDGG